MEWNLGDYGLFYPEKVVDICRRDRRVYVEGLWRIGYKKDNIELCIVLKHKKDMEKLVTAKSNQEMLDILNTSPWSHFLLE